MGRGSGSTEVKQKRKTGLKQFFEFHGNITTVPPIDVALKYALKIPYREGMPGPSKMWSTIADTRSDAVKLMKSDTLMTLVLERLDESLVAARHYLGWTLGDMVHTKNRKALASHPTQNDWQHEVINKIRHAVTERGEVAIYQAGNEALDMRLKKLREQGINVDEEIKMLKELRIKAQNRCFEADILDLYKRHIKALGFDFSIKAELNNHRDVEEEYAKDKMAFALNKAMMYVWDACGGCEANAMELSISHGLAKDVKNALYLEQLPDKIVAQNKNLLRCPHPSLKIGYYSRYSEENGEKNI